MYFPHKYRSLNGRPGGRDGQPVPYEYLTFDKIALYNLDQDISEIHDVADQHPEIVEKMKELAIEIRNELGDQLTGVKGQGIRPAAQISYD